MYKIKNIFCINTNETNISTSNFQFSGILKYIPLIICGGFFSITILLFIFGPYDWKVNNPLQLYSFLFLTVVALSFGYCIAIVKGKISSKKLNINISNSLILCCTVYFLIYFPTVYAITGKIYPDIITGLTNAGLAYRNTKYYNEFGSQTFLYIRMILSPFLILITPVTLFLMPKLTKTGKLLGILVILFTLFLGISQGINKYCADLTGQIVLFLVLLLFTNNPKKSNIKYRLKIISLIILVCLLFFTYYSVTMHSRVSMDNQLKSASSVASNAQSESPSNSSPQDDTEKNVESTITQYSTFGFASEKPNVFYDFIPSKIKPTALFLTSYITHGYKGLSIAMNQDFTSSYGLGFSDFFRHNLLKIAGQSNKEKEIYNRTYIAKTSLEGWVTGNFWSTFFVYPASDISFFGTIVLVFLIGYFWGLSWKDFLITENLFSITVFFNLCIMVFYFPANNQLFQGGESAIGFTVMFILWLVTRHKKFNGVTTKS